MERRQLLPTKAYKRLVSRDGHFNVDSIGLSWWKVFKADVYHYYLNMSWYKLIFMSFLYYALINLLFAALYMVEMENINSAEDFADVLFFSVQTMSTIGYGNYYPKGYYLNTLVFLQSWAALVADGVIAALIIAKISRPNRLRHTVVFSELAVINSTTSLDFTTVSPSASLMSFSPLSSREPPSSDNCPSLSFRILNLRKRQLSDPTFRLLLMRREENKYAIYELDFEINKQIGRTRAMGFSVPYLPLPWVVTHKIDKNSPLYQQNRNTMINSEYELIAILDCVDELSGSSFLSRWSYLPSEIRWEHSFVEMVKRNNEGVISVDYDLLSETVPVSEDDSGHNNYPEDENTDNTLHL
eukprot:TRINITY_DN6447_c0_g1_i1.p1 TRINITY_DN6447_c0_g1~~TRINITY_DN6447_c0_g1_i1.p1  ORF type:complete len:356 (-),score=45.84 TRINITY_DN6447_c0_g1_i1:1053-2120(-)